MIFFSENMAYWLQFITLPLEVVGLTLATIEVRFPGIAEQLSNRVLAVVERNELEAGNMKRVIEPREVIATMLLIGVLVVIIFVTGNPWTSIFGFFGVALIVSLSYVVAVKWVPGRTIGTLGLIVAGFGVLGEFYQMVAQVVH